MTTEALFFPELNAADASKFITYNANLRRLESTLCRVKSKSNGGPPASPANGDAYIVDVVSGAWSSFTINNVVQFVGGQWLQYTRSEGMRVWLMDTDKTNIYTGTVWTEESAASTGISAFTGGSVLFAATTSTGAIATIAQDNVNFNYTNSSDTLTVKNIATQSSGTLTAGNNLVVNGPTTASAISATSITLSNNVTVTSGAIGALTAGVLSSAAAGILDVLSSSGTFRWSYFPSAGTTNNWVSRAPAAANVLQHRHIYANDSGSVNYGTIELTPTNVTASTETSKLIFKTKSNGVDISTLTLNSNGGVDTPGRLGVGNTAAVSGAKAQFESNTEAQLKLTHTNIASYNFTATAGGALEIDKDGTDRIVIASGGDVQILNGLTVSGATTLNAGVTSSTITASGLITANAGVRFPSGATTLTHYEEGSFTPVVVGTTTAGAGTYTSQAGKFQRIGNWVYFSLVINQTAHTGTGNMQVNGLPYAKANDNVFPPTIGLFDGLALTAGHYFMPVILNNSSSLTLQQLPTGGGPSTPVPMDAVCNFNINGFYSII